KWPTSPGGPPPAAASRGAPLHEHRRGARHEAPRYEPERGGGETVHETVHEHGIAAERPDGLIRHLLGAHPEESGHGARVDVRLLLELGAREPRAHAEHLDAGPAQLGCDRLAEAQHERLRGAVRRAV